MIDEEGVELSTRGVPLPHVQRLEIVPVGLHLRTLGHAESKTEEDVLESLPGLGDDVQVASGAVGAKLGEVESFLSDALFGLGASQLVAPLLDGLLDRGARRVHGRSGRTARLGINDAAEPLLQSGERTPLAEVLRDHALKIGDRCGLGNGG